MHLRLIREPSMNATTLGVLFVDGRFFSFSLEDEVRERAGEPVESWKVPGKTAIPAGRYAVKVSWSPRFQRPLPEILDVPGFTGIRIHIGNRASDTSGCILVGFQRSNAVVLESTKAFTELQARLEAAELADEPITIEIENPRML